MVVFCCVLVVFFNFVGFGAGLGLIMVGGYFCLLLGLFFFNMTIF